MGSLIHIDIQNRASSEYGVLYPLTNREDDRTVIFREILLAALDIPFGFPDESLLRLLGKMQELLVNIQNEPLRVPG